jgi:hypothetical protein
MPSKQKQRNAGSKSKKTRLQLMAEQMTQLQQEITNLQSQLNLSSIYDMSQ